MTPAPQPLDLQTIMADPDWMGQAVESPYWSADGRSLYYSLKRDGSTVHDLYRVDPASGQSTKLEPAETPEPSAQPEAVTEAPAQPESAPKTEIMHNHAQMPIRLAAEPGRNSLCPCGSGLKFKRCCANHVQPQAVPTAA